MSSDMSTTNSASMITPVAAPDRTRTTLHESVGFLRSQVREIDSTATGLHKRTWDSHIDELARSLAKNSAGDLLGRLSDWGFSWRDVARMMQVSVPAVQKWRRGERATGENRLRMARVVALIEAVESEALVAEPGSWFEMPLTKGVAVTPIDLVAADKWMPLIEFVLQHRDATSVLDDFEPQWREKYVDATFETFVDDDGYRSIRPRS